MAIRYSGSLTIKINYRDSGYYHVRIYDHSGKLVWKTNELRAPAAGLGAGVAYDSRRAYDKMARAALGFAGYENEEISNAASHGERDYVIRHVKRGAKGGTAPHVRRFARR